MNLANKLTLSRIVMAFLILVILLVPFEDFGLVLPTFYVGGKVVVELRYIIAGFLFVIACLTDYLDGSIARKNKQTSDFGATMDAIADKVLVNGVLIILAYQGFIALLVPIVIVLRDICIDALRALSAKNKVIIKASKWGKVKTVFMMIGISLLLFYNLPFELWGIYVADICVYAATVLSVVSGVLYFIKAKEYIKNS